MRILASNLFQPSFTLVDRGRIVGLMSAVFVFEPLWISFPELAHDALQFSRGNSELNDIAVEMHTVFSSSTMRSREATLELKNLLASLDYCRAAIPPNGSSGLVPFLLKPVSPFLTNHVSRRVGGQRLVVSVVPHLRVVESLSLSLLDESPIGPGDALVAALQGGGPRQVLLDRGGGRPRGRSSNHTRPRREAAGHLRLTARQDCGDGDRDGDRDGGGGGGGCA